MSNPLMGMMGGAPAASPLAGTQNNLMQAAQSAKRMMGMLRAVKNPQQALMMAAQKNPQLNAVMQMCQGKDPQQVFYDECKKHNVDPEQVMSMLR